MRALLASIFLVMTAATAAAADFEGAWRVDEAATLAQRELGRELDAQMASQLPLLVEEMRPVAYRFERNSFVTSLGERSESVPWSMLEEDSREFRLRTRLRGELAEIRIQMLSLNQLRILSDRDDDMQLLIWQRVDEDGAGMDALAMR